MDIPTLGPLNLPKMNIFLATLETFVSLCVKLEQQLRQTEPSHCHTDVALRRHSFITQCDINFVILYCYVRLNEKMATY